MLSLGPNTNAPADLLSPTCILVAGEDRGHLLPLLNTPQDRSHAFRGYEFWKQSEVAQFYAFCENFGGPDLRYNAIKGVSNELGDDAAQIQTSQDMIRTCFEMAKQLSVSTNLN